MIEEDKEFYLTVQRIEMEYDCLKHECGDDSLLLMELLNCIRCFADGNKPGALFLRAVLASQELLTQEP